VVSMSLLIDCLLSTCLFSSRRHYHGVLTTKKKTMSEDFSQLWERHIAATRHDFVKDTITARDDELPTETDKIGKLWEETMGSVVDALEALDDLAPSSRGAHSPEPRAIWSSRDDYTETALSSPQDSHFSTKPHAPPAITISDHDREIEHEPEEEITPMVEIGGRRSKGKELASYYLDKTRLKKLRDWHNGNAPPASQSKHLLYSNYNTRYIPETSPSPTPTPTPTTSSKDINKSEQPDTPITSFRTIHSAQSSPPSSVNVLILTWARHDRRGDDGQLLSPSLDIDTDTVRSCFKRRGYRVQCRLIPEDYPTSAVETILSRFLSQSTPDTLHVIYYHGYGNVESSTAADGRMVFSSGFGGSSFFWDDIRNGILTAEGDVLLVMDCSAAPGAEQNEVVLEAGISREVAAPGTTKLVLGACAPYSSSMGIGNKMTRAMCAVLEGDGRKGEVCVQGLCSRMKEWLRDDEDPSAVFVTQLGGGQLLDIYLPRFI